MKTYTALREELAGLREAYLQSDETERIKLKERGEEIHLLVDSHRGCYTCDIPVHEFSPKFPFCTEDCHEAWLKVNPLGQDKREGRTLPIEYMQEKLLEFAEDERNKK